MAKLSAKRPKRLDEDKKSNGKIEALNEIRRESHKKLNVNIPEQLHYKFKIKCLEDKTNMSSLIKEWIEKFIK